MTSHFKSSSLWLTLALGTSAAFMLLIPLTLLAQGVPSPEGTTGAFEAHQASDYQPLTGIPGVTDRGDLSLAGYVNALFMLSITLGAILAVVKIAIGGFQYMLTDMVTTKESAKKNIKGALLGLAILLASVAVLTTIYPGLVNLNILGNATRIEIIGNPSPSVGDDTSSVGSTASGTPVDAANIRWTRSVKNLFPEADEAGQECENNGGKAVTSGSAFDNLRVTCYND